MHTVLITITQLTWNVLNGWDKASFDDIQLLECNSYIEWIESVVTEFFLLSSYSLYQLSKFNFSRLIVNFYKQIPKQSKYQDVNDKPKDVTRGKENTFIYYIFKVTGNFKHIFGTS